MAFEQIKFEGNNEKKPSNEELKSQEQKIADLQGKLENNEKWAQKIESKLGGSQGAAELQNEINDFVALAAIGQLSGSLKEYNVQSFDTDTESGLDMLEYSRFTAVLDTAVDRLIMLGGMEELRTSGEEAEDTGMLSSPDKYMAGNCDFQEWVLRDEKGQSWTTYASEKLGIMSEEDLNAIAQESFNLTSLSDYGDLTLLMVKELGEGVEDTLRMIGNVNAAVILLPRYATYRAKRFSDDPATVADAELKIEQLVEENPALALPEILGDKGGQMLKQLASMVVSGKKGDIAMLAVTIAGMLAGGAGASKVFGKMKGLSKVSKAGRVAETVAEAKSGARLLAATEKVSGEAAEAAGRTAGKAAGAAAEAASAAAKPAMASAFGPEVVNLFAENQGALKRLKTLKASINKLTGQADKVDEVRRLKAMAASERGRLKAAGFDNIDEALKILDEYEIPKAKPAPKPKAPEAPGARPPKSPEAMAAFKEAVMNFKDDIRELMEMRKAFKNITKNNPTFVPGTPASRVFKGLMDDMKALSDKLIKNGIDDFDEAIRLVDEADKLAEVQRVILGQKDMLTELIQTRRSIEKLAGKTDPKSLKRLETLQELESLRVRDLKANGILDVDAAMNMLADMEKMAEASKLQQLTKLVSEHSDDLQELLETRKKIQSAQGPAKDLFQASEKAMVDKLKAAGIDDVDKALSMLDDLKKTSAAAEGATAAAAESVAAVAEGAVAETALAVVPKTAEEAVAVLKETTIPPMSRLQLISYAENMLEVKKAVRAGIDPSPNTMLALRGAGLTEDVLDVTAVFAANAPDVVVGNSLLKGLIPLTAVIAAMCVLEEKGEDALASEVQEMPEVQEEGARESADEGDNEAPVAPEKKQGGFTEKLSTSPDSFYKMEEVDGKTKITMILPTAEAVRDSRIQQFVGPDGIAMKLENPDEYQIVSGGKEYNWDKEAGTWKNAEGRLRIFNGTELTVEKKVAEPGAKQEEAAPNSEAGEKPAELGISPDEITEQSTQQLLDMLSQNWKFVFPHKSFNKNNLLKKFQKKYPEAEGFKLGAWKVEDAQLILSFSIKNKNGTVENRQYSVPAGNLDGVYDISTGDGADAVKAMMKALEDKDNLGS
ncbi:hypothetical protein KKC94_04775 [Patescibacteria group bacterium]|nr:hypothetical protein [Patescibacteria group bacterium]